MALPQMPIQDDLGPEYYYAEDASTQTTDEDFNLLEQTLDASTQTIDEELLPLERTRDVSTQTTDEDLLLLEQVLEASTQTTDDFFFLETVKGVCRPPLEEDFYVPGQIDSNGNDVATISDTRERNRKRNVSGDHCLTHDKDSSKLLRTKMYDSGLSDEDISTSNEQDGLHTDNSLNTESTYRVALDESRITSLNNKMAEIEESHFHNQEVQEYESLGSKNILASEQNAASNMAIFQNEDPSNIVSDSESSEWENELFVDDSPAVLGSSRSDENMFQSNLSLDKSKNETALKLQTIIEKQMKTSMCLACRKEIAKHVKVVKGKNLYKCCKCRYRRIEEDDLRNHIWKRHVLKRSKNEDKRFLCNKCNVRYAIEGSHESEQKCNACERTFQCITQLEEHYATHKKRHISICMICQTYLYKHMTKLHDIEVYRCCVDSKHIFYSKHHLRTHLYIHSNLKLFKCNKCGIRLKSTHVLRYHYQRNPICKKRKKKLTEILRMDRV